MIVLRRPWSAVAGCAVGITILVVTQLFFRQSNPLWVGVVVLDRSGACLVLAWFSAALRQLLAAREDLAIQAVLRERVRIDAELAETVGTALGTIAGRGADISRLNGSDSASVAAQLRTLVDGSRQTLAETRRMIRAYQRGSLGTELDTAVALLGAAGIQARLVLPAGELVEAADEDFAASIRSAVDRLLHDGSVRSCRLTVVRSDRGPAAAGRCRQLSRGGAGMTLDSLQWITRRAPWAMLGLHLTIVVLPLVLVTTGGMVDHSAQQIAFAVPALAAVAVLHLRHVRAAARGTRPNRWPWSLAALALLTYLPLTWIGADGAPPECCWLRRRCSCCPGTGGSPSASRCPSS